MKLPARLLSSIPQGFLFFFRGLVRRLSCNRRKWRGRNLLKLRPEMDIWCRRGDSNPYGLKTTWP
jgi:hypothetical protein